MAYNEKISNRIREALVDVPNVAEKHMFGGLCFMVNGKMCIGINDDEMMCRINPADEDEALSRVGSRPMDFTGKPMKGYVYVNADGIRTKADFEYWIGLCLEFNKVAKASKKKKK